MTAPAAPAPAAQDHSHLKHLAAGAAIGGVTVAAGVAGARRFTTNAGHATRLYETGHLVHAGPKVYGTAHPSVVAHAKAAGNASEKLRRLTKDPEAMGHLHADLRSATPSKEALHLSNHMAPNGNTNPIIAHSRGKFDLDLLHDPLGSHKDARVHAIKTMIAHSNPADTHELHRGMRGVEHQVGDVIDFGHMSSFTSTKPIAEAYAKQQGAAHRGVYSIPKGATKAMPLDGTSWTSRNHEWLAGGKFRVAGKQTVVQNGTPIHHYDLAPHTDDEIAKYKIDQPHTNAYHYFRGGLGIGQRRAKLKEPGTKATYDRTVNAIASGWGAKHGTALRAGYKVGQHAANPKLQVAAGATALAGATGVVLHRRADKGKGETVSKSAFGVSKADDHRPDRELQAIGVAGIGATVSHNRIGRGAAAAHTRLQSRRLKEVQAQKATLRQARVSPPPPHSSWRAVGAERGVSRGAARRAALGTRSHQLRQLQGRENRIHRAMRASGAVRSSAASAALRGGLVVGPAALYLGTRKGAQPIAKYTKGDVDAGTAGAAAGLGAHQAAGWYGGHALEARAKRKVDADPALKRRLSEHRAASGIDGKTATGSKKWLGFFRKYPRELPGSKTKRALSYTHAGRTGVAVNAGVAVGSGALAVAGVRRHRDKIAKASDGQLRRRVIRRGPYTKANRKQLGHHVAVGAGLGSAAGAAGGAHLGAHLHGSELKRIVAGSSRYARIGSRGRMATSGALLIGGLGAVVGASSGRDVARVQRHQAARKLSKSEPLAIAGKLWRKPTVRSEFRRAFSGTRKGEKIVDRAARTPQMRHYRDRYGYPRSVRSGESMRAPARAALHARTATAASYSPHKTGFNAGVKAGRAVASAGRHPEYAISVPAVGAGAGLAHHEIKRSKKKGTEVAKSAFGVELEKGLLQAVKDLPKADKIEAGIEAGVGTAAVGVASHKAKKQKAASPVAKLGPPKVTYQEAHVTRRNEKKNKTTHYGPRRIHTERTGKTLILRRKKYHAGAGPTVQPKDGDLVSVSPKMVVGWKDGRRLARAHESDAKHVTLSSGHTVKHRSIRGDAMSKSAFGVEDHRVEKNILTEGFSAGMELLHGFKGGMSGAVGAERSAAGATGKIAGAKTMGKLKPIGAAATKTPARTAATAGLGGLGLGIATSNRNR